MHPKQSNVVGRKVDLKETESKDCHKRHNSDGYDQSRPRLPLLCVCTQLWRDLRVLKTEVQKQYEE